MKSSISASSNFGRRRHGMALVIVLSFVVLLTGLMVAYVSRAITSQQVAGSEAHQTRADLIVRSAMDIITADLRQEIVDGSDATTIGNGTSQTILYLPKKNLNMLPVRSGNPTDSPDPIPNLIRRSVSNDAIAAPGVGSRASGINSTTDPSPDGRFITLARWNSHYLIPRTSTGATIDSTPVSAFTAPDWVLLTRSGPVVQSSMGGGATALNNPTPNNPNYVIGRYAYAIYDEGGLLDINVAGYPMDDASSSPASTGVTAAQASRRGSIALADLSQLSADSSSGGTMTALQINNLVGWRNYACAQPSGAFANFSFNSTSSTNWIKNFIFENGTGYLKVATPVSTTAPLTDQAFLSRQQLISMRRALGFSQNALQYLGTFSRSLSQPSYAPPATRPKVLPQAKGGNTAAPDAPGVSTSLDDLINPSFLTVRVPLTKKGARNDGSDLTAGEPFVKRRFALSRLAWVTWEGPSSTASSATKTALRNAGISQAIIDAGTLTNIQKYFGLTWSSGVWKYNVHNGGNTGQGSIMRVGRPPTVTSADPTTYVQDAGREPDFFELLKASLNVGSLGKSLVNSKVALSPPTGALQSEVPENYCYRTESSVDYQVIQIGANIIDQFDPDGYPTRIVFDDGSLPAHEFQGVENLPYLYNIINGVVQAAPPSTTPDSNSNPVLTSDKTYGSLTSPGLGAFMQFPVVWNPHDINSPMGNPKPAYFRAVVDSTTPDNLQDSGNGNYNRIFVYASSSNVVRSGTFNNGTNTTNSKLANPEYSFTADTSSPTSNAGLGSLNYTGSSDGTTLGHTLYANNSGLTFQVPNSSLFREPTVLLRGDYPQNSGLALDSGHLLLNDSAVSGRATAKGLKSYYSNAASMPNGDSLTPAGTPFVGFYMGAYPLRWLKKGSDNQLYTLTSSVNGAVVARVKSGATGGLPNADYFTYRLQYSVNPGGPWITYDTKYGLTSGPGGLCVDIGAGGALCGCSFRSYTYHNGGYGYWASVVDPRSSRFGLFRNDTAEGDGFGRSYNARPPSSTQGTAGWIDPANSVLTTIRPDGDSGFTFSGYDAYKTTSTAAGWNIWTQVRPSAYWPAEVVMKPGLLCQNNTDAPSYQSRFYGDGQGGITAGQSYSGYYYADPDGVVRRGMSAFVPPATSSSPTNPSGSTKYPAADTTVGLPMARATALAANANATTGNTSLQASSTLPANPTNQAQSRPYVLNRPFQSVAELGYVFRDTPWRNLDFFTPESGDTALLDVFCINDTDDTNALVAGKVNLNTRQQPVLKAMLAGACLDDAQAAMTSTAATLNTTAADKIATALIQRTTDTQTPGNGPITNPAELVGKWNSKQSIPQIPGGASDVNLNGADYLDGKRSYKGFTGDWDSTNRKPAITKPAVDLNSAYDSAYSSNSNHNGLKESVQYIQRMHEAPMRVLAGAGQTRVWNLLIDVIAQSGSYGRSAADLKAFNVRGEQRWWIHVAIDRFTGQVIDQQIEVVKE